MKNDMGGAAGILAAFRAAALSGAKDRIYALLCLAENAVDERAGRPDDIHQSYSGKTVEVNNTDAEGRLVMADGLAHATRHLNPDVVLDMSRTTSGLRCRVACARPSAITKRPSASVLFTSTVLPE